MQFQAVLGSGRQAGPITGIDQTQVTLSVHMHADGLEYRCRKQRPQKRQGHELVQIVCAGVDVLLSLLVGHQHVTQVMQQSGHNGFRGFACFFSQISALQCMFELIHRLHAVLFLTLLV